MEKSELWDKLKKYADDKRDGHYHVPSGTVILSDEERFCRQLWNIMFDMEQGIK